MLIGKAAYFKACNHCGAHGHFVLADDSVSRECYSREDAMQVITDLVAEGKLASEEEKFLRSAVPELKALPRNIGDLSLGLVFCPMLDELAGSGTDEFLATSPDDPDEERDPGPTVH